MYLNMYSKYSLKLLMYLSIEHENYCKRKSQG